MEAFSDGVLAVAITLLVLDLHASAAEPEPLSTQLQQGWPSFAAYAVSFFVIGVVWINHHAVVNLVARVDRRLLFYNLLLLFFVTTIPFTTSTLAEYLYPSHGSSTSLAVLLYGVSTEGMAVSFTLMLWHMTRAGLTTRPVTPQQANRAVLRFGVGTLLYPLVTLLGLVSAPAMLLLYAALTAYYVFEQTPILGDGPPEGTSPSDAG
ncbi:Potassium channel [Terrabacter sp. BE26]